MQPVQPTLPFPPHASATGTNSPEPRVSQEALASFHTMTALMLLLVFLKALMCHKATATWPDVQGGDKSFARAGKILHKIFQHKMLLQTRNTQQNTDHVFKLFYSKRFLYIK